MRIVAVCNASTEAGDDLTVKFGRGFSYPNLNRFRQFYLAYPREGILSTVSIESKQQNRQTPSGKSHMVPEAQERVQILQTRLKRVLTQSPICVPYGWYLRRHSCLEEKVNGFSERWIV